MRAKGVSVISSSDGPTEIPEPTGDDEESIKRYMEQQAEQWKLREEAAMNVSVELFDIDNHTERYNDVVMALTAR